MTAAGPTTSMTMCTAGSTAPGWLRRLCRCRLTPFPAVVGFYIGTALAGDVRAQPVDEAADADKLAEAVALLHQWSNWEQLRRDLTLTAAVLGDVFLKVAERQPSPEEGPTAVYMQDIPPQNVRWWDADERGYLTGIRIDTARLESIFSGEKRRHTLVEVWRKEWPTAVAACAIGR
jgi:hypothetical protein